MCGRKLTFRRRPRDDHILRHHSLSWAAACRQFLIHVSDSFKVFLIERDGAVRKSDCRITVEMGWL